MRNEECCGTCKWNRYDPDGSGVRQGGGFYCGNERSENCGVPTFYDDGCDEWEGKERERMPTNKIDAADVFFGKLDSLTSDEPGTINLTMESPEIKQIHPNRYELIKDVIKYAVTHDKTVSISEVNEMFSVTIHNDDEVE